MSDEHREQAVVVRWFDLQHPSLRGRLFAVPNGAHLAGSQQQRAAKMSKLKAEGLRDGVPDLLLPVPRGQFCGLFIEMKPDQKAQLRSEQVDWLDFLGQQGYYAVVCRGSDAAIETIRAYMDEE